MDRIILSFNDACLYESDLDILKSETTWINDRIITFYFEYLKEVYEAQEEILFIGSEVTQAIKIMENPNDVKEIILEPLKIQTRNFILFVLNDNEQSDVSGGSHWTLLVYSKPDKTFFHFDSLGSSNYHTCSKFVKIFKACLSTTDEISTKQVDCLQQSNSYDCGIYVLCHADLACKKIVQSNSLADIKKINYKFVTVKRNELAEIVQNLSNKKT